MSRLVFLAALAALLSPRLAAAHSPGESYLHLVTATDHGELTGRWEIALRDLDDLFTVDADGDGAITRRELEERSAEIIRRALAGLGIIGGAGPCAPRGGEVSLTRRADTAYASLALTVRCPTLARGAPPTAGFLEVDYRLLLERDSAHRGILQVSGKSEQTAVARAGHERHRFPLGANEAGGHHAATLGRFVTEGVVHIWQGPDHLLFLLVLLLPAVLRRERSGWTAAPDLGGVLQRVIKVVTAFTAAHSLTLALAALGVVRASPSVIEPAIAASVLLAAASNLWPPLAARMAGETWALAFGLGLLHGFGFSSVLAELGLPPGSRLAALVGFNLGVELGQLALVLPFVPLSFLVRRTSGYRVVGLQLGSAVTALVATFWLIERIA